MGQSPPIPVNPIRAVPDTVLRHTPSQTHGDLGHSQPQSQQRSYAQQLPQSQQLSQTQRQPQSHQQPYASQQGYTQNQASPQSPQGLAQPGHAPEPSHSVSPLGSFPTSNHPPSQSQHHQQTRPNHTSSRPGFAGMQHGPHMSQEPPHQLPPGLMSRQTPNVHRNRHIGTQRAHSLSIPARSPAADKYLDRLEHDAKLQAMILGKPLATDSSQNTSIDKPLPDPRGRSKKTLSRRQSLMDDLHNHRAPGHISSGDRYPSFPVNGQGHSRQTSFNSNIRQTQDL